MKTDADSPKASKLTLRIENALIERAKSYARQRGMSLSQLIADYFRAITALPANANDDNWEQNLPPITRSLVKIAAGAEADEEEYRRHLIEKYA